MNRASEFKVAAKTDGESVEASLFELYRDKVGKSLRRVVMSAVARVYDRNLRAHCRRKSRALFGVAHRNYIYVI